MTFWRHVKWVLLGATVFGTAGTVAAWFWGWSSHGNGLSGGQIMFRAGSLSAIMAGALLGPYLREKIVRRRPTSGILCTFCASLLMGPITIYLRGPLPGNTSGLLYEALSVSAVIAIPGTVLAAPFGIAAGILFTKLVRCDVERAGAVVSA